MLFPNVSSSSRERAIFTLVGSIFIRAAERLPGWFRFNYEEYGEWRKLVEANGYALERTALAGGWYLSYIVPPVQHAAWGLSLQSAVQRAVDNVFNLVSGLGFNSLEIAEVTTRSFFVVYLVRIVANPRHLRRTPFLNDSNPHYYPHSVLGFEEIFWRAAEVQPQLNGL